MRSQGLLIPSALPTRVPDPGNNGCRSLYAPAACVHFRPVDEQPLPQRCKRIHCSIGRSRSCPGVRANIPSSILVAENGFQRDESGGIRAVRRTIVVRNPDFSGPLPMSPALRPTWSRRAGWSAWGARSWPRRPSPRGQRRPAALPSAPAAGIRRSAPQTDWLLLPGHPGFVPGDRFMPHPSGKFLRAPSATDARSPRIGREGVLQNRPWLVPGRCSSRATVRPGHGPLPGLFKWSRSGSVRLPVGASHSPHSHQVVQPETRMPPDGVSAPLDESG